MKAFIGHSFDEKDKDLIDNIKEFIESTGIGCVSGEKSQNRSIAQKVKERIISCEIFVGIFTCDKLICQNIPPKWICNPKKRGNQHTTSNWVLQESGFAIGHNREMILLVENGVDSFPELQGDMEVIFFDRNLISEKHIKLSQMLEGVKTRTSVGATTKPPEESKQIYIAKSEEQKEQPKTEVKDKKAELLRKVYIALWADKDYKKAWEIFEKEAEAVLDEDDRIWLHAFILKESHSRNENAFRELEKLAQDKKDNPRVIKQLAHLYKEIGEFKKASEKFLLAASKYDVNNADKRDGLIDAYIQAAWCLTYDDNLNAALEMLRKLLPNFREFSAKIFEAMARISKDKSDIEYFLSYAENALESDPVNTQLRVDLAYAYSNNNNENLALLHYKKLTDTIKHGIGLNNMGVSYGHLDLKGKSIRSYFKASEEKQTVSMGNLAYEYISAGFINDAQDQIDKANKLSNEGIKVNSRVADAQHKMETLLEEEDKKEENILSEAKKESQYRIKYSNALCSDVALKQNQIGGIWQTPWGNLQLNYKEESNIFQIDSIIHTKEGPLFSAILSGRTGKQEEHYNNRLINIKGTIAHLSGKYIIKISDEPPSAVSKKVI
jgi:hypothetical protein